MAVFKHIWYEPAEEGAGETLVLGASVWVLGLGAFREGNRDTLRPLMSREHPGGGGKGFKEEDGDEDMEEDQEEEEEES